MMQKQLAAELGSVHTLRKNLSLWDSKGKLLKMRYKEPSRDGRMVGHI